MPQNKILLTETINKIDQVENFTNLKKVIEHYLMLKQKYGMESVSMQEMGEIA